MTKTPVQQGNLDLIASLTPALFQAMRQGLTRLVDETVVGELRVNPDAVRQAKSLVIALQDAARRLDEAINAVAQEQAAQTNEGESHRPDEPLAAAAS